MLAVAYYGMEFPDDVDALIEEAILGKERDSPSPYEEILHRDLLFAIRCLDDQDAGPHLRRWLVSEFSKLWLDRKGHSISNSLRDRITHDIQSIQGSPAGVDLEHLLLAALQDENADVRRNIAFILKQLAPRTESRKFTEIAPHLAAILDLPGMDILGTVGFEFGSARSFLIDALYAIAPYPLAND